LVVLVPLTFDSALSLLASVFDLLKDHHPLGEGPAALVLEKHVDIARRSSGREAFSGDDQCAGHAASDLDEAVTMAVRMIPVSARRMVGWDVILVPKAAARRDRDQDIVTVSGRRDPQAVGVQIG